MNVSVLTLVHSVVAMADMLSRLSMSHSNRGEHMRNLLTVLLFAALSVLGPASATGAASPTLPTDNASLDHLQTVSTFSIVAIDPQNGDLGVAVASRYFSV